MTLTLELTPEIEARLQALAAERGAPMEAVAKQVLAEGILSDDEIDALLDKEDAEWWERERHNYDPSQNISLEDLKAQLGFGDPQERAA